VPSLAVAALLPADKGEAWDEGQPVSGVQYKDASGQMRISKAHLTVCCDGMYSTFRKKLVAKPSIHHPSFFVALLLRGVTLPFPNHGHVVLCQPSPVLFYPISSKEVRKPAQLLLLLLLLLLQAACDHSRVVLRHICCFWCVGWCTCHAAASIPQ
jgi:hypothetical protein